MLGVDFVYRKDTIVDEMFDEHVLQFNVFLLFWRFRCAQPYFYPTCFPFPLHIRPMSIGCGSVEPALVLSACCWACIVENAVIAL